MSIRTKPFPSKFIVEQEFANDDKLFGNHIRYPQLLQSMGGTVTDYTDLTEAAKGFYSAMSETLSQNTAPWIQWVKGTGGYKDITTEKVRWRTYGKPKKKFTSLGNPNNCAQVGAAGSKFKVLFDIDHLVPSDRLAPVENSSAVIVILSNSRKKSGGYEYDAELALDDTFLPSSYLTGKYWCRAGQAAAYAEPFSGQMGSFSWDTGYAYVEYEIPIGVMAKEYSVDMETHLKEGSLKVACTYGDDSTRSEAITNRIAIEFDAAFEKEMERMLIHGQMSEGKIDPVNRKPIKTTPGLYQYLSESNIIKYNPFVNSIDMIMDLIQVYWYDRVPAARRKLVLMTGEAGLKLFHNWVLEKFGQLPVQVEHNFVLGTAKAHDASKTGYSLGGFQFTKYNMGQPFGEVSVGLWPMLDDTLYDAAQMPNSIYTVRSHEFIAMDWGMGDPNVQLLRNSQRDWDLEIPGYWSSYGAVGMKNPYFKTVIHPELGASYKVQRTRTLGLAVMDVSRILRFIPSIS